MCRHYSYFISDTQVLFIWLCMTFTFTKHYLYLSMTFGYFLQHLFSYGCSSGHIWHLIRMQINCPIKGIKELEKILMACCLITTLAQPYCGNTFFEKSFSMSGKNWNTKEILELDNCTWSSLDLGFKNEMIKRTVVVRLYMECGINVENLLHIPTQRAMAGL